MKFSYLRCTATLLTIGALVHATAYTTVAFAQSAKLTPQACLTAITTYEREQMNSRAQTGVTYAQITAGKVKKAQTCVAAYASQRPQDPELPAFARLQLIAGDTATATTTIQTYLAASETTGTDSARAERYTVAIPLLVSTRSAASFEQTEQLANKLDSMSTAMTAAKVAGHGTLLGYYRAIDVDEKIDRHASRVIALAPALDSAQRQKHMQRIVLAYTSLAEVYGNRAQAPEAVALLTRGIQDLADLSGAEAQLADVRDRYALVGKPGAPIVAEYWLNAPAGTKTYSPKGNVTLLEFSAHWCGPCHMSYPAVTRLHKKYAARGLKTVFATNLYGFIHDRQNLTPAQEVEADREYFLKEQALPAQIAINPEPDENAGKSDPNSANYKVGGIPHIAIIDKAGMIRMIVIGWDPASETRLDTMLDQLISEP
jgi:thiol-disulfide isomerase/thioredoxin